MLIRGRVYSPGSVNASAMLVADGIVAWVGDDASALTMSFDEQVDLQGALVLPAFVDGHFHTTDTGRALTELSVGDATSVTEVLDAVRRQADTTRGRPILGTGWDESDWPEQRPPTATELDRASYGGLVYLSRTDAHSAVASSSLMAAAAGLTALSGYHPSGLLTKDAHHAVRSVALATVTGGRRRELQRAALQHAAAQGIVAIHEMAGPDISSADDLHDLLELAGSEALPQVFGFWGELNGLKTAVELGAVCVGGDLFCDGSLGSHTAALHEPYADRDDAGFLRFELGELIEHITSCSSAGMLAGFHAIGDAAIDQVVDAMVAAQEQLPSAQVSGAGHRLEHAELATDVQRIAAAGLTASVQPAFDATWGGADGMYERRLGDTRAARMNPFASLAAAGVPLVFGSDSPVTAVDPWAAIRAAVHPSNPRHALSPRAAFTAHTRGGWRSVRADGSGAGVLRPGSPATYAVFSAGSLAVDAPADDRVAHWSTDERAAVPGLPDLAPGAELPRCLRTVLDGREIFDAGQLN